MKTNLTKCNGAKQFVSASQNKFRLAILLLFLSVTGFGQIPSGYYDYAAGKTGDDLKLALHLIIKGHTEYPYTSGGTDVRDILKVADRDPADPTRVIGIYSGFSMTAADEYDGGNGWSREHVWAKSRGDFGTSMGPGTDVHHIRAADISTNSARGNRNFDYAPTKYIDYSGTYSGSTDSYYSDANWVWEPRDEVKGDVARMIFYMTVRYEGTDGEPDLELTDSYLSVGSIAPLHGKASVLMEWHLNDPVDAAEIQRNNVIYGYQNNRNPFIDHPEYACLIYPIYCGEGTDPGEGGENDLFISEYIEGSSYNKALEIANTTGITVNLSNYSLKKQVNGSGSWGAEYTLTGSLGDGGVFVIAHSSAAPEILAEADVTTTNGIVTFNGNDPIGLFKSGELIDIIGVYNGGSGDFAKDLTVVRKSSISSPNTTYTFSEWDSYTSNTFDYLGEHAGTGGGGTAPNDLFFAQYIEGTSYNKALEIINITGGAINLSGYDLRKQTNGSGSWGSIYALSGSLADGETFMIAHSSANMEILTVADVSSTSGIVTFNGNDPIGLFKDDILIDIIGVFNGGSGNFAKDVTLERKVEIEGPNTTYTVSEWNSYAINTVLAPETESAFQGHEIMPMMDESAFPESIRFYPNPTTNYVHWEGSSEIKTIQIINLVTGQEISSVGIDRTGSKADLSQLANGLYGLIVTTHEHKVKLFKIVKQ